MLYLTIKNQLLLVNLVINGILFLTHALDLGNPYAPTPTAPLIQFSAELDLSQKQYSSTFPDDETPYCPKAPLILSKNPSRF